eukprot:g2841.t1
MHLNRRKRKSRRKKHVKTHRLGPVVEKDEITHRDSEIITKDVKIWTSADVQYWLNHFCGPQLAKHADAFKRERIDGSLLLQLDAQCLHDLSLNKEDQKSLLSCINQLKNGRIGSLQSEEVANSNKREKVHIVGEYEEEEQQYDENGFDPQRRTSGMSVKMPRSPNRDESMTAFEKRRRTSTMSVVENANFQSSYFKKNNVLTENESENGWNRLYYDVKERGFRQQFTRLNLKLKKKGNLKLFEILNNLESTPVLSDLLGFPKHCNFDVIIDTIQNCFEKKGFLHTDEIDEKSFSEILTNFGMENYGNQAAFVENDLSTTPASMARLQLQRQGSDLTDATSASLLPSSSSEYTSEAYHRRGMQIAIDTTNPIFPSGIEIVKSPIKVETKYSSSSLGNANILKLKHGQSSISSHVKGKEEANVVEKKEDDAFEEKNVDVEKVTWKRTLQSTPIMDSYLEKHALSPLHKRIQDFEEEDEFSEFGVEIRKNTKVVGFSEFANAIQKIGLDPKPTLGEIEVIFASLSSSCHINKGGFLRGKVISVNDMKEALQNAKQKCIERKERSSNLSEKKKTNTSSPYPPSSPSSDVKLIEEKSNEETSLVLSDSNLKIDVEENSEELIVRTQQLKLELCQLLSDAGNAVTLQQAMEAGSFSSENGVISEGGFFYALKMMRIPATKEESSHLFNSFLFDKLKRLNVNGKKRLNGKKEKKIYWKDILLSLDDVRCRFHGIFLPTLQNEARRQLKGKKNFPNSLSNSNFKHRKSEDKGRPIFGASAAEARMYPTSNALLQATYVALQSLQRISTGVDILLSGEKKANVQNRNFQNLGNDKIMRLSLGEAYKLKKCISRVVTCIQEWCTNSIIVVPAVQLLESFLTPQNYGRPNSPATSLLHLVQECGGVRAVAICVSSHESFFKNSNSEINEKVDFSEFENCENDDSENEMLHLRDAQLQITLESFLSHILEETEKVFDYIIAQPNHCFKNWGVDEEKSNFSISTFRRELKRRAMTIQHFFYMGDHDRNDMISFKEFKNGMYLSGIRPVPTNRQIMEVFQSFDRDDDGFVTWSEISEKPDKQEILYEYRLGKKNSNFDFSKRDIGYIEARNLSTSLEKVNARELLRRLASAVGCILDLTSEERHAVYSPRKGMNSVVLGGIESRDVSSGSKESHFKKNRNDIENQEKKLSIFQPQSTSQLHKNGKNEAYRILSQADKQRFSKKLMELDDVLASLYNTIDSKLKREEKIFEFENEEFEKKKRKLTQRVSSRKGPETSAVASKWFQHGLRNVEHKKLKKQNFKFEKKMKSGETSVHLKHSRGKKSSSSFEEKKTQVYTEILAVRAAIRSACSRLGV